VELNLQSIWQKKRIGIPANKRANIIAYPKTKDFVAELLSSISGDDENDESVLLKQMVGNALGLGKAEPILSYMPQELRSGLVYAVNAFAISKKEQVVALMPYLPKF